MANMNTVEVRIAGKEYKLKGIESPEYIQKIALFVDRKLNETLKGSGNTLSTSMASVLTAVNITDEYFKTYDANVKNENELKEAKALIAKLQAENKRLNEENKKIIENNTKLQLELAKREAELSEVRSTLEKTTGGHNRRY